MKERPLAHRTLALVVSITASVVLAVSLIAIVRYHFAEGRALVLVSAVYAAVGLASFQVPAKRAWLPWWVIPAGAILATLEVTSICLEQFIELPSPANAVVPASMEALIVLAASTAAVVGSARDTLLRGVACALVTVGLGMLLSVSTVLVLVAVRSASQPGMGPLLHLVSANATLHLTLPLGLACIVGSAAAAVSARTSRSQWRTSALVSLAGVAMFAAGVTLLVRAPSLPRAERPPLVVPGMALSALGLVLLPCILGRPQFPGHGPLPVAGR
jgi:hypothetical protein